MGKRGPQPGLRTTHNINGWSWNHDLLQTKIPEPNADGCCNWQGAMSPGGALFGAKKAGRPQMTQVSRLIWLKHNPDADMEGMEVAHTCKNRQCVNIEHLALIPHGHHERQSYKKRTKPEAKYVRQ